MTAPQNLIVISGPTGSGKTALAVQLCQELDGAIISADSRQVYKKADIGTNKLDPATFPQNIQRRDGYWIQEGIKIYLYDIIAPGETFSVAEFIRQADSALNKIQTADQVPLLVGGTGFYLDAFLGRQTYSTIKPDWSLRQKLTAQPVAELQNQLRELDPASLSQMTPSDRQNPRRLIRYLELARHAGSASQATQTHQPDISPAQTLKIGLRAPRGFLYQKADRWAEKIVAQGLIEETKTILDDYGADAPLLQGLIYAPAVQYLRGKIGQAELLELIQKQLHDYIRRQLTWFKRDPEIHWLDVSTGKHPREARRLIRTQLAG